MRRWWDETSSRAYPDDEVDQYRARIRGSDDSVDVFLIRHRGRPLGFAQCYRIEDSDPYGRALALDASAAGIDLFIGEPAEIGRGHGPRIVRAFLREVVFVRHDVAQCVIGPSVRNTSAIRAYEKAGFHVVRDVVVPEEPDPERLMRIGRDEVE